MPIDPRIALGYQPPQMESPVNMMLTAQKMQAGQQENALRQAQMENYQAEVARRNALLPHEIAKAEREARAAETAAQTADTKRRRDMLAGINDPQTYDVWRQDYVASQPWVEQYLPPANQFTPDVKRQLLTTADEAMKRTPLHFADTGGAIQGLDPLTGMPVGPATAKTATPGQKLTDERLRAAATVAQNHPLLTQAILEGRVPVARVNSRTAGLYEAALQGDPTADLTAISLEQTGAGAGARTAGTAKANIGIASDEANRMIGIMREIIPTVNLTDYPSINAVTNAVSKGTGGVEIVKLNTAINSLINSYARAINPRGQPTVSDKNHARDIINNAMSKGQLAGALEIMQQEMEAALGAATTATKPRGSAGGETPAPSKAATPPTDLAAAAAAELARRRKAK